MAVSLSEGSIKFSTNTDPGAATADTSLRSLSFPAAPRYMIRPSARKRLGFVASNLGCEASSVASVLSSERKSRSTLS